MAFFQTGANNTNGSRILALIVTFLFVIGSFLPLITGHSAIYSVKSFVPFLIVAFIITVVTDIIGFENKFETNDPWKTLVQAISGVINIIGPAIYIAVTYNV